ncbi:MAG TPA: hypothetical protein VM925_01120 [Labilithrix sp.]|nr:hypothetical protein [Labilithrix sp.]
MPCKPGRSTAFHLVMARNKQKTLGLAVLILLAFGRDARADEARVTVGRAPRFSEPPVDSPLVGSATPVVVDDHWIAREPELRRSPFRLTLGPAGVTTGKGFGVGVGVGADFGTGSVGGRIAAAWLRGEGRTGDGTSSATGDSVGHYSGELTLDLHKRGPVHPVIGMGVGLVHVSRPDARSGFAGTGTGRFALEYALGFDDADVRACASVTAGLIGPVDSEVKDLRAYALTGLHLAIGF